MSTVPRIRRVVIRNYKSIPSCDVKLGPLTFVVGPNGSGKSNFVGALKFVADAVRDLDQALRDRGGLSEVRRRSRGHPTHFSMKLELILPSERMATYEFCIRARSDGAPEVQSERCWVGSAEALDSGWTYEVTSGQVRAGADSMPPASPDRLYLQNVSGMPGFREVYDVITRVQVHSLNPAVMRQPQAAQPGDILTANGSNLPSIVHRLAQTAPDVKSRIEEYLAAIVPGVVRVDRVPVGAWESLEFSQRVASAQDPWRFWAVSMSDGTLRALGILVALFQGANGAGPGASLVGIEEPETALHPGALGALLDALVEASAQTQVVVTSHSADLLDDGEKIPVESILAVDCADGNTIVAPLEAYGRKAIRDRLFTPGELLRANQIRPETQPSPPPAPADLELPLSGGGA